jgi:elongation factor Ts
MAEITASLVKELREKSGAGMMDCKKALQENGGDLETSMDWLRKKGIASAAKKSSRIAAEGLIAVSSIDNSASVIELNSETDFVAKNEEFQMMARKAADMCVNLTDGSLDQVNAAVCQKCACGKTFKEELTSLIAKIGENMNLRRSCKLTVKNGVVSSYVHAAMAENVGKIGVLVALESDASDKEALNQLGKQIAMHIAATSPKSLSVEDLDPEVVEREKAILTEQAKASGKPENIIEKMMVGRINKFYQEVVLLEQTFVVDGESIVKDVIARKAKELGSDIKMVAFERFALGEGLEKRNENFAEEVAAQINK